MDVIDENPPGRVTDLQGRIPPRKPHLSVLPISRKSSCVMCGRNDNCEQVNELRAADISRAIDLVESTGFVNRRTISAMRSEVDRHCPGGIDYKSAAVNEEIQALASQLVSSVRVKQAPDMGR